MKWLATKKNPDRIVVFRGRYAQHRLEDVAILDPQYLTGILDAEGDLLDLKARKAIEDALREAEVVLA